MYDYDDDYDYADRFRDPGGRSALHPGKRTEPVSDLREREPADQAGRSEGLSMRYLRRPRRVHVLKENER